MAPTRNPDNRHLREIPLDAMLPRRQCQQQGAVDRCQQCQCGLPATPRDFPGQDHTTKQQELREQGQADTGEQEGDGFHG